MGFLKSLIFQNKTQPPLSMLCFTISNSGYTPAPVQSHCFYIDSCHVSWNQMITLSHEMRSLWTVTLLLAPTDNITEIFFRIFSKFPMIHILQLTDHKPLPFVIECQITFQEILCTSASSAFHTFWDKNPMATMG